MDNEDIFKVKISKEIKRIDKKSDNNNNNHSNNNNFE